MNKDILKFYSTFVNEYDDITSFNERLSSQSLIIDKIIEKYNIKEALDAGCGTGFYSILLAKAGVKVTAFDVSSEMVNKLIRNAKKLGVKVNTLVCDLLNVDKNLNKKFDAIFCLGNTIPHILKLSELFRVYKNFFNLLKPNGVLIIQQLNYDRILKYKEKLQNIKTMKDKVYVRFYEYEEALINFYILMVNLKEPQNSLLEKVLLRPHLTIEHKKYLLKAGYRKIYFSSDLGMDQKYNKYKSKDLVITAIR